MSNAELTVEVKVAWWLGPYLSALAVCCRWNRIRISAETLDRIVRLGIRIRAGGKWQRL